MKQHDLTSTLAMLDLTPEEFERMLPDLMTFHRWAREAIAAGAHPKTFIWIDDGRPGELHSIRGSIGSTGRKFEIRGSAWVDPA